MAAHRCIGKIGWAAAAACVLITVFLLGGAPGLIRASASPGYEGRLFDTGAVHTIDIVMEDWEGFLSTCENEEYSPCSVVIDGEAEKNVGIRAKGNTSLTQVAQYGNGRYSFKIEFDHYQSGQSYYGLDKLSLNNLIQDNTCMKDYLVYQMMGAFGAPAPLCSYAYLTVNGEDWGLYLAVEGVEEAFLQRNFGKTSGALYKPDSMDMGGGRGNGGGFSMGEMPDFKGGPGAVGGDDVSLVYTDDSFESYKNIFENAKTDVTDRDKERLIGALKRLNDGESLSDTLFMEEVLRYFVVHNFVCNFDSYTGSMVHNYYLYEEDGRLAMIPWDYNLAFGGFMGAGDAQSLINFPLNTPVSGGTVDSRPMLAWVFSEEGYTEQYHALFEEFLAQFFDSGRCVELIESTQALIAPYIEKDPTKFCTYEEFEAGAAALQTFCALRAESLRGQLQGAVPATQEAQSQQPEALIEAGELAIDDMGGMGGMGNMGSMGPGGQGFPLQMPDGMDADAQPPDFTQRADQGQPPDFAQRVDQEQPPDFAQQQGPGSFTPPGQEAPEESSAGGWALLGASFAVLAVGLGIAFGYKRKV